MGFNTQTIKRKMRNKLYYSSLLRERPSVTILLLLLVKQRPRYTLR